MVRTNVAPLDPAFRSRAEVAAAFLVFGASMLRLGSGRGGSMPSLKVACLIDGELKVARTGETTHREICNREAVVGSVVVDGYLLQANDPQ